MFGFGGDPFQGQQQREFGGPLVDIEGQVSGVLNSADQNRIYIPAGPGGIIQVPRPQAEYRVAPPVSPRASGAQATGPRGGVAVVGLLLAALIVTIVIALT